MLLILGLMIVITVFVLLMWCDVLDETAAAVIVVAGVFLFVTLVVLPVSRSEVHYEIVAFQQVEKDIFLARKSKLESVERAALTRTIIKYNTWLAIEKYRNAGFWDIFIPDEVDTLKKLQ